MRPARLSGWLLLAFPAVTFAQTPPPAEAGGTAEIALQGYYLGGNSQPLTALSGLDISFREFLPSLGLITGNLEGYVDSTRGRLGDNSLTFHGLRWKGRRWTITGGDYFFQTSPVPSPFSSYAYPQASARGVKVEMTDGPRQFTLFAGEETLQTGPRITFRTQAPQFVLGGSVRQRFGTRLRAGVQYLGLSSGENQVLNNPAYFPAGSQFTRSDSLSGQVDYFAGSGLEVWGSATLSRERFAPGYATTPSAPFSWIGGAKWRGRKLNVTASYGSLTRSALPVIGYYFGDRRGPSIEARYKIFRDLELFGSGVISSNNLEHNPGIASLSTESFTAGASVTLPGDFGISGQYSKISLRGGLAGDPSQDQNQHSSQTLISLSKTLGRQSYLLTFRDLDLNTAGALQKQKSAELQDSLQYGRFQLSAAVRLQQENGAGQLTNSVFARTSVQWRVGQVSIYGQLEKGSDLINKSLFATNNVYTAVAGVRIPLKRGWILEAEAFRTTLLSTLNPANILLLQAQGVESSTVLNDFNQWSFLVRAKRNAHWGASISSILPAANEVVYGAIAGFVYDDGSVSSRLPGIAVQLDQSRTATTDETGRYRFADVPEGPHTVLIDGAALSADYSAGPAPPGPVVVRPRVTERVDLRVVSASSSIRGVLSGLAEEDIGVVRMERIVINLSGGGTLDTYTTCDSKGGFAFYNLRAGHYTVTVERSSLPADYRLISSGDASVDLETATPPPISFRMEKHAVELPRRKVIQLPQGM
jgi:hypothetical protein